MRLSVARPPARAPLRTHPRAQRPLPTHPRARRRPALLPPRAGGPAGGGVGSKAKSNGGAEVDTPGRAALVAIGLSYVGLVLFLPAANVFYQAFRNGFGPFWDNVTDPDFLHAVKMTGLMAAIAVPINTAWGVAAAILIARSEFRGKATLLSLLDLPFSVSPVVAGMMLVLLYGRSGVFGPILAANGVRVLYAAPGMVLATLFVTLPYVCRELVPVLEAQDLAEEEAARTLGASSWAVFTNVTLPSIKWGLLYGMVLTNARAVGEFGAVAVVSGNIIGRTQTLTLFVESAYKEYSTDGAFAAAVLLSLLAFATLYVKDRLEREHGEEI